MALVVLARRARRELLELDWPLIDAIEEALGQLEREPLAGHALRGRLRGLRSLRAGTYRIVHQVSEDEKTVRVAAIRHRPVSHSAGWSSMTAVQACAADASRGISTAPRQDPGTGAHRACRTRPTTD